MGSQNLKWFKILWSGERMWFKYETWLKYDDLILSKVNRSSPICAKPFDNSVHILRGSKMTCDEN